MIQVIPKNRVKILKRYFLKTSSYIFSRDMDPYSDTFYRDYFLNNF